MTLTIARDRATIAPRPTRLTELVSDDLPIFHDRFANAATVITVKTMISRQFCRPNHMLDVLSAPPRQSTRMSDLVAPDRHTVRPRVGQPCSTTEARRLVVCRRDLLRHHDGLLWPR